MKLVHALTASRWTAIMVGIPFMVVTSYVLYGRCMSLMALLELCLVLIIQVVLGQEQKPLSTPPDGPPTARNV